MTGNTKVSVVLTTHREGMLLSATLKTLDRAMSFAEGRGVSVDVILSLDRADKMTKEVAMEWASKKVHILENDFGDPGQSRNRCIREATGEYIAILDGDDLVGSTWLSSAYFAAASDPRRIVWHPEVNVIFGEHDHIFWHQDMEAEDFDPKFMIARNPWTALCFAKRHLFLEIPYPASDFQSGIGHEDWAWNCKVAELGYLHKVVLGTGHLIRRKEMSQVKLANSARTLPQGTDYFREELAKRDQRHVAKRLLGSL